MRRVSLVLLVILNLTACAARDLVLEIQHPEAVRSSAPTRVFKLVQVVDRREFQARPRQANQPSLTQANLVKPEVVARAVGRRRGAFGKARGEILFDSQSPVTEVVRSCVEAAVAKNGGVLVDARDPRYADALPMRVYIDNFWAWLRPGAWVVAIEFDATLLVQAAIPGFEQGRAVHSHAELRRAAVHAGHWQSVIEEGVDTLTANLSQELRAAFK